MMPLILKLSIEKIIWFKAWGKVLIFKRRVWPAFFYPNPLSFPPARDLPGAKQKARLRSKTG
jgi:hypothetical protein